jgi:hypothetical protein
MTKWEGWEYRGFPLFILDNQVTNQEQEQAGYLVCMCVGGQQERSSIKNNEKEWMMATERRRVTESLEAWSLWANVRIFF